MNFLIGWGISAIRAAKEFEEAMKIDKTKIEGTDIYLKNVKMNFYDPHRLAGRADGKREAEAMLSDDDRDLLKRIKQIQEDLISEGWIKE